MRQMTLFDVEIDTKNQKYQPDRQLIGEPKQAKMTPCVFCGVMPEVRHRMVERSRYYLARCPVCGYQCGTHYGITDQWNSLNTMKWRMKHDRQSKHSD